MALSDWETPVAVAARVTRECSPVSIISPDEQLIENDSYSPSRKTPASRSSARYYFFLPFAHYFVLSKVEIR